MEGIINAWIITWKTTIMDKSFLKNLEQVWPPAKTRNGILEKLVIGGCLISTVETL